MANNSGGTMVFHHNGIGDYVMSLPALRLLAEAAPRPFHLVCGNVPASCLYNEILADDLSSTPVRPGRFAHCVDTASIRLSRRHDFFVSLATWDTEEIRSLARASGARTTIGLFSWYSLRLENKLIHDMLRLFALALPFAPDARFDEYTQPPQFGDEIERLRDRMTPPPAKMLVVHGDTRKEKVWPRERYDGVLAGFLDSTTDWTVVALNFLPAELPRALSTARVKIVSCTPLSTVMRLVAEADMFLGVDSSMLHVADLARVPGVSLFGPTSSAQFGYCLTPSSLCENLQAPGAIGSIDAAHVLEALCTIRERLERP